VRDRLGIKPLFWSLRDGLLLFGSELKALRAHPACPSVVSRAALASYMRHSYVPAPLSILDGVHKLQPGRILTVAADGSITRSCYWDALDVALGGMRHRHDEDEGERLEELDVALRDAVRCRMIADVPLGAFLSGGIDSSLVVALMQDQSPTPVRTFSIGFHESGYDEAGDAAAVASHLGTQHTELYVEPSHALEVIPDLPQWYDEPFADSSQIPTYLVSRLTRRHVTVSLSGDGGDELFAGYNRYLVAVSLMHRLGTLPRWLRRGLARALEGVPPGAWDTAFRVVPPRWRPSQPGDKLGKLAGLMRESHSDFYRWLVSHWQEPAQVVPGACEHRGVLWDAGLAEQFAGPVEHMQYMDLVTYLPDDILTKVDRASMAVSLEARVPLLDHRVVELSWRLPQRMKVRDGLSKWALRQALRQILYRHVPRGLVERPKMGFGVPIDSWLRGPLRDWAEVLLGAKALEQDGFFAAAPIRERWQQHLSGRRNWQYLLWDVLMFQAWKARWQ
jgi:asparagine synthase (glutamine-hydrolysing)